MVLCRIVIVAAAAIMRCAAHGQGELIIVGNATAGEVSTFVNAVGDRGLGVAVRAPDGAGQWVVNQWLRREGFTPLPVLDGTVSVLPSGIAPTLVALGTNHAGLGTNRPGYWTDATGLIEVPLPDASPGPDRGFILDISATGIASCLVYLEDFPDQFKTTTGPALFSPPTGRIDIAMPDDIMQARPNRISRNASVVSGFGFTGDGRAYPWRWTASGGVVVDRTAPQTVPGEVFYGYMEMDERGETAFGEIWITEPGDPFPTQYGRIFARDFGGELRVLPGPVGYDDEPDGTQFTRPRASYDGERILVEGGDNVRHFVNTAWIYDGIDSVPVLATEFFAQNGVDFSDWSRVTTQAMSRDGTTFAGIGDLDGERLMWMVYIPPQCPADVNGDGELTPADFQAWVDAYFDLRIVADQNLDAFVTPSDFNAWILNYNTGCD